MKKILSLPWEVLIAACEGTSNKTLWDMDDYGKIKVRGQWQQRNQQKIENHSRYLDVLPWNS